MSVMDTIFSLCVALGVTGLAIDGITKILPPPKTSDFFQVSDIRVVREGDTALLYVDRDIIQPIYMTPNVRIMAYSEHGWREVCIAQGPTILYSPDNTIDQPVDLAWWTWDQCKSLPDGPTRIITTWVPRKSHFEPVTYTVNVDENL
jgi:hypothetical protein